MVTDVRENGGGTLYCITYCSHRPRPPLRIRPRLVPLAFDVIAAVLDPALQRHVSHSFRRSLGCAATPLPPFGTRRLFASAPPFFALPPPRGSFRLSPRGTKRGPRAALQPSRSAPADDIGRPLARDASRPPRRFARAGARRRDFPARSICDSDLFLGGDAFRCEGRSGGNAAKPTSRRRTRATKDRRNSPPPPPDAPTPAPTKTFGEAAGRGAPEERRRIEVRGSILERREGGGEPPGRAGPKGRGVMVSPPPPCAAFPLRRSVSSGGAGGGRGRAGVWDSATILYLTYVGSQ